MAFRFIHTADWQLGKAFGQFPAETAFALRTQRLTSVETIAALARQHAVDAVLVAGDAFDSNTVADRTLIQAIEAIRAFPGPWVFLPGNHDAALSHSVWSRLRAMGLPGNVVIADAPTALDLWDARAMVLPAPMRRRRETEDLTRWFCEAPSAEGTLRIGLAHGSLANRLPGEAGHEIAEDRAARSGLAYLALGDWHGAQEIAPRTFYAGTPEPDRHKTNEVASGSVYLVEIEGTGAPARVIRLAVGRFAWVRHEIALLDGTSAAVADAFDRLTSAPRDTVLSLALSGTITLAERYRLERLVAHWSDRLHHLEVDDGDLREEPTPDDLDAIDTAGFVRLAVDRLQAKAADPHDPDHDVARVALRMIYLDHVGGAS